MKCSFYAIMLGGDTDTIGCMACAIAGAYLGSDKIERTSVDDKEKSTIPVEIFKYVEDLETINEYADWLIKHNTA